MSEAAQKATAHHEAGHAVAAWHSRGKVQKISILPDSESSGRVHHVSPLKGLRFEYDDSPLAHARAKAAIVICLAGPEAQRRFNPRSVRRYHAASDHRKAAEIAFRICGSEASTNAYLRWLEVVTKELVDLRWPMIEKIAATLLQRRELSGADVSELLQASAR